MSNFESILESIGYTLIDNGKNYRAKPLYRDSDNDSVLCINKEDGYWFDFKTQENGSFEKLVEKTLQIPSGQIPEWLEERKFIPADIDNSSNKIIIEDQIFDDSLLKSLTQDHSYWEGRGISEETLKVFKGGVCKAGKMKNRYIFPIFNSSNQIIGVSGRMVFKEFGNSPKWKHLGLKKSWAYPTTLNLDFIRQANSVVIVESIGDMLALWKNGVKTSVVSFGLDIQPGLLNFLLKVDVKKIIIAFNNDSASENAGNIAAEKQYKKLLRHFDQDQVFISLPDNKDFGEMNPEQIIQWKKKTKNICLHRE